MTYKISAQEMGWMDSEKDYVVDDVTITIDRDPDGLSQQDWEKVAEWFDETFPLTEDEVSHGFARDAGRYTFD